MKRHLPAAVLLVTSVILAYSNSLNGAWAMDDALTQGSIGIHSFYDLIGFRKVAYLTFLLNYRIGSFDPAHFRFVNILIHVVNVFLVYILAYKTTRLHFEMSGENTEESSSKAFSAAIIGSALFALHPININAVAYIIQRMASLSTLFVLAALIIYINARQTSARPLAFFLYLASVACMILGIFSKENAVMAIPLIMLYDYVFLSRFRMREFSIKLSVIVGIGALSVGLASYFLNLHVAVLDLVNMLMDFHKPLSDRGWMAIDVSWTPFQHILTEFRVVSRYIFLLFLPLPGFLVFDWLGYPVSQGVFEPVTTILSIIFLLCITGFSFLKIKRYPFLCFGILWYFIAVSLESFFALGADLYFEHRNYLPVSGLMVGLAGHIMTSFRPNMKEKTVFMTALIVCCILGSLTFWRNTVWKDPITLWEDTVTKDPSNYRAYGNLGVSYRSQGLTDKSIQTYQEALRLKPDYAEGHYNIAIAYQMKGLYENAESHYMAAIRSAPDHARAFNNLCLVYRFREEIDRAIEHCQAAVSINPDFHDARYNLGNVYLENFLYDEAIEQYKAALEIRHEFPEAHYNLGKTYHYKGLIDEAIEQYKEAIRLKHDYPEAYTNLGVAYKSRGATDRALKMLQTAVRLDPDMAEAHYHLGLVFRSRGLAEQSQKHLNIARRLKSGLFR
jgi:tetratricopeptide (TPR) repeat protein